MSQPYYLRIRAYEFKSTDFVKYAVGIGGIPLCSEKVSEWECTVVFHGGVVKYYQDRKVNITYWVIEVYGNHHDMVSILQDFVKDVVEANVESLNTCGDCYCG
mgnify:CR=1 FL=1